MGHSREKPFQCGGCGRNYAHRTILARHQVHYCDRERKAGSSGGRPNASAGADLLITQGGYELLSMPELEPAISPFPSATPISSLTAPPLIVAPPPSLVPKWKREAAVS